MVTELSGKSGAAFNAAYASHMARHTRRQWCCSSPPSLARLRHCKFRLEDPSCARATQGMAQELVSKRKLTARGRGSDQLAAAVKLWPMILPTVNLKGRYNHSGPQDRG